MTFAPVLLALALSACCASTPAPRPGPRTPSPNPIGAYRGVKLIGCHDGDTCTIARPAGFAWRSARVTVRLLGIDTPEIGRNARCAAEDQAAVVARLALLDFLRTGPLDFEAAGTDKYGRILGRLSVGGVDSGDYLIKAGLARPYGQGRRPWCDKNGGLID